MRSLVLCLLVACGSGSSPATDAKKLDGAGGGSACTGAVYDPCTENTQCMSGMCHLYTMANLQVCTTTCTAGDNSTCPTDASGSNGFCNPMSNCKPAVANSCTR